MRRWKLLSAATSRPAPCSDSTQTCVLLAVSSGVVSCRAPHRYRRAVVLVWLQGTLSLRRRKQLGSQIKGILSVDPLDREAKEAKKATTEAHNVAWSGMFADSLAEASEPRSGAGDPHTKAALKAAGSVRFNMGENKVVSVPGISETITASVRRRSTSQTASWRARNAAAVAAAAAAGGSATAGAGSGTDGAAASGAAAAAGTASARGSGAAALGLALGLGSRRLHSLKKRPTLTERPGALLLLLGADGGLSC